MSGGYSRLRRGMIRRFGNSESPADRSTRPASHPGELFDITTANNGLAEVLVLIRLVYLSVIQVLGR